MPRAPAILSLLCLLAACTPPVAQQSASALPPNIRPDLAEKWHPNGQIMWPPNDGCAAAPVSQTLPTGTLIDRFGSEGGTFFSPRGESYAARAVPYVCSKMAYTVYRVDRPLPVQACRAAPWFDEPGGATQYKTDAPAYKLREAGTIEVATGDSSGNGKPASPCGSP